ncbi:oxysterol-binding protein-related protein 5 isoform X3 [Choloepus didactylus]|uniref:oxysterol-binding protein-related protein 5 isoform X3 n=1 Tax=Choloepus didactylus TaxID=27675 RepID=UPI00189D97E0|nr:oxysterol-binding protein-related protein 5 isoform X3 [Choloepus didactylus]
MKEEAFLRRRFSLCPPSSTPQKAEPRKLSRNLLFSGESELYPLSPGKDMEPAGPMPPKEEGPPTPGSATKVPPAEYRLCNGSDRECVSPTAKATKKETLKAQKENYRQEKKRATRQLLSALTDPSVVIMADSLKIRGTLKSWTKLWCVLKPGVLLIYKTPKVGQWVGTVLLHCCELIERPSKKDGFCFKLFHPLDQSVWAVKGPKGESVGSITQPLPSSYLIFRAASESDGRCWLDALELALRCSSLLRLGACKQGRDGEPGSSPDASPSALYGPPASAAIRGDQDLFPLNGSSLENDAFSDKSEKENAEESDAEAPERGGRPGGSGSEGPGAAGSRRGTTYVGQAHEELGEQGERSQVEAVSEENRGLIWVLLRQLRPGMDLSRVVLPTAVLEPRSFLSKLSDHCYHADLLSRAALEEDAYGRMKHVLRWYLSGFYKKPQGIKKPYNPILGETFRCCWFHPQTNSHTFYIAEQVSHHPPVSAFHVSNRKDGFCISGSITAKSRFYGNSLSALLDGKATLSFLSRAEDYTITMPYAHCKGILYGTMTMELGGKVTVECEKNRLHAELEFKLKPFFAGSMSINQISGKIASGEEVLASLVGHWDREVFIKDEGSGSTELFWNPTGETCRQRLKRYTVLLEEQTELESERLPEGGQPRPCSEWARCPAGSGSMSPGPSARATSTGPRRRSLHWRRHRGSGPASTCTAQHPGSRSCSTWTRPPESGATDTRIIAPGIPQGTSLSMSRTGSCTPSVGSPWLARLPSCMARGPDTRAQSAGSARPATSPRATARPLRAAAPHLSPALSSQTRTTTSCQAGAARVLAAGRRRGGCRCCTRLCCPFGRPSRSCTGTCRPR